MAYNHSLHLSISNSRIDSFVSYFECYLLRLRSTSFQGEFSIRIASQICSPFLEWGFELILVISFFCGCGFVCELLRLVFD